MWKHARTSGSCLTVIQYQRLTFFPSLTPLLSPPSDNHPSTLNIYQIKSLNSIQEQRPGHCRSVHDLFHSTQWPSFPSVSPQMANGFCPVHYYYFHRKHFPMAPMKKEERWHSEVENSRKTNKADNFLKCINLSFKVSLRKGYASDKSGFNMRPLSLFWPNVNFAQAHEFMSNTIKQ